MRTRTWMCSAHLTRAAVRGASVVGTRGVSGVAGLVVVGVLADGRVYPVPRDIDREIARLKLESMGISIDRLTEAQREHLSSWTLGT